MAESKLRNFSKDFAKEIVLLCREIKSNHRESVLTNQILRSGTSIGANIHEELNMHREQKILFQSSK